MVTQDLLAAPSSRLNGRQQSVRHHARGLPLRTAVRMAARILFHFDFRCGIGQALWSKTERVWLGRETFLHWAIWDEDLNITRAVAGAYDAPDDAERLREAVFSELMRYWTNQLACLPVREVPRWWPLP